MFEGSQHQGAAGGDGRPARPGLSSLPRRRNRDSLAMLMPYGRRWRQLRQAVTRQGAAQTLHRFSVLPVETMQSKRPLVAHNAPPPRANRCADLAPVAKQGHARGVDASNLTAGTLPPGDTHLPMLAALVCRESRQANSSSPRREPETTMNMGRRIAEPMANAAPKHGASWGETGKAMLGVPSLSNFMPFPYDDSRRSFQGNSRCHGRWAIAPRRALAQALLSAGRSGFASPRTRVNQ